MSPLNLILQRASFYIALLLLAPQVLAEQVESVQYRAASSNTAGLTIPAAFLGTGHSVSTIPLPNLNIEPNSPDYGPTKTGIVYALPSPLKAINLPWEAILGGYVARVHLQSEQAKRLRLHIVLPNAIKSIQFRVQGNLDAQPFGPFYPSVIQGHDLWLPLSNGNSADIEIFVDGSIALDQLGFSIDAVNLISADKHSGDVVGSVPKSLGLTHFKEFDYKCWINDASFAGLTVAAGATAKINFINNGNSYTCSGTLLNDKGSSKKPWFATANHCIPDQTVADTASFEWFFQATFCEGSIRDPRYAQTSGGAQLLYTDFTLEPSFLKLNQQPPSGVYFSGWDTNIQVDSKVWGVHHPEGDHTMVSQGFVTALQQNILDTTESGSHILDKVTYNYGGIEPGSSGSGLFSINNGVSYWRGTLFGGQDSNYQIANYSHLQGYYNSIKQWLENTSSFPDPVINFTASPTTVNYLASTTLRWFVTNAKTCNATTSYGWSGDVELSGTLTLTMGFTTTYTLNCTGNGGTSSKSVTVTVNPAPNIKITCLLNWAEINYPELFSPAGARTIFSTPYTYRYYSNTKSYVGVSSLNNHVYYLKPDAPLEDEGELSAWLETSSCL